VPFPLAVLFARGRLKGAWCKELIRHRIRWHYASSETEILGLILRAVTGKPVADYLSEKIWQRIGTEADASWAIDGTGQEVTFCCFNAVLRDYARFGRLLAHDGTLSSFDLLERLNQVEPLSLGEPDKRGLLSFKAQTGLALPGS
jgi:CubicO group peptidase (beta-lactamase class C family)